MSVMLSQHDSAKSFPIRFRLTRAIHGLVKTDVGYNLFYCIFSVLSRTRISALGDKNVFKSPRNSFAIHSKQMLSKSARVSLTLRQEALSMNNRSPRTRLEFLFSVQFESG